MSAVDVFGARVALEEPGVDVACQELRVAQHLHELVSVRGNTVHPRRREGVGEQPCCSGPCGGPRDHLREHGVVVRRDVVATQQSGVHTHVRQCGNVEADNAAGLREVTRGRVLCTETDLDGVPVDGGVQRSRGKRSALSDGDLEGDEVEACHEFRDRVLHLQPRVHLEEVEAAVRRQQELHGARTDVPDGAGSRHGSGTHLGAQHLVDGRGGGLLDDLLVAPLDRALALEQRHAVAVPVREHLDLDMPAALDIALDEHGPVTEGRFGLTRCRFHGPGQFRFRSHDPHATASTACGRLHEGREAGLVALGQDGHARGSHEPLRLDLGAH